ncbi:MAG: histidinol dehydrogenase [Dehalococcoidales bacterium]|nr:histidinol dehydrogenase [Dehalococcoidales bacterium]
MLIIEGIESARPLLTRKVATDIGVVSSSLKQRLQELFGVDDPESAVRQIIDTVRCRRDAALFDYTAKIDGIRLVALEAGRDQIEGARRKLDKGLLDALELAAERIRIFHTFQKSLFWQATKIKAGTGGIIRPLERVGVYAPGGTASYPSTVLMTAIPARVAGVREVVLATPPASDGAIPAATLAAADIAGVNRVFAVGGAQAIAALAFGTESVPKVDKICGPGNIFIFLAKKLVYGAVDIDGLQGPSEVLVIADETAKPEYCAADLLAQAEHDALASAILITTSRPLAEEVNREVERQLRDLPRQAIAMESLNSRGRIIVVNDVNEAIDLANLYAPEHLCLAIARATDYIEKITNAGCIFVGENSAEVLGDYVAGPSHVLPTGGTARFSSPLNVSDFMKLISFVSAKPDELSQLGQAAMTIARAEGLEAHARAMEKRLG